MGLFDKKEQTATIEPTVGTEVQQVAAMPAIEPTQNADNVFTFLLFMSVFLFFIY